jgi:hypothetical protein
MLFAAVARLDVGLSLETVLTLQVEKSLICLVGIETNSIHNRTTADFLLENVNKKYSIKMLSSGMKCFEI